MRRPQDGTIKDVMSTTIATERPETTAADDQLRWSPLCRGVVSLILATHLFAVFVAPWASPPPSSELALFLARRLEPYLVAAYLNHGYRYFAPNPGPSHLVRYELTMADGRQLPGLRRIPDLTEHWPRLMYHRYFMISERVGASIPPPPAGINGPLEFEQFLQATRAEAQPLVRSIAEHLKHESGAVSVKLYLQKHLIPSPQEVLQGMQLNDSRLYREQYLGELTDDGNWIWSHLDLEQGEQILP